MKGGLMFELFFVILALILGGTLLIGVLKLLVAIALIPLKLAWWLVKGVVALVLIVPLTLIAINLVAIGLPVILFVLVLPLVLGVVGLVALVRCVF
jgi:hypothetical protein